MSRRISRRSFLEKSVGLSAGAALVFGFEEKALLAHAGSQQPEAVSRQTASINDSNIAPNFFKTTPYPV